MIFPVDRIFYISLPSTPMRTRRMVQYLETIGLIDKNGNKPILKVANNGNRVSHKVDNSIKIKNKRSKTSI